MQSLSNVLNRIKKQPLYGALTVAIAVLACLLAVAVLRHVLAEPMKQYRDTSAGYQLSIPAAAKVSDTDLGKQITFDSHAKLTILRIPNYGLAENNLFADSTKQLIKEDYRAGFDIADDAFSKTTVDGKPALGVRYEKRQEKPVRHVTESYVVHDGYLYVLMEETPGRFDTLDRMVDSFQFTK